METCKVSVRVGTMTIPTYPESDYETLPMFAETRNHQGTSGNPFPNAVTSSPCAETPVDMVYDAVTLENRWLEVTVLPGLGGRIFSARDKRNGYDIFYRQHVIKPALIGDLGSWISGGVEFNWPFHHRPATYMPADWSVEEGEDGSATVWLSDSDPFYRMRGTVGVRLYPDRMYLETAVRVTNRTELRHPFLWWENAAVSVNGQYRLFFPHDVDHVVHHYRSCSASWPVAKGNYGGCDFGDGTDISRIANAPHATSYFAAPSRFDFFGGYDEGRDAGVMHVADHHIAPGKKMFTWGQDQNARDWEKKLTDTDGPYCELMAGTYTDNQPDFTWLEPYETKSFSQYWIPLMKTGIPDYANLSCAVRVNGDGLTLQTTRPAGALRVTVTSGGECLLDAAADCGEPALLTFDLLRPVRDGEAWTVRVLDGEEEICLYTNEAFPKQEPRLIHGYPLPADVKSPFEAFNLGEHLIQYRDPRSDAEVYFRRALELDPSMVPAALSLAECHIGRGLYAEAEAELTEAVARLNAMNQNPESGRAYYLLGLALERQGRFAEAYDRYRKAAWSRDTAPEALTRAAVLACRRGDFADAERLAGEAVRRGADAQAKSVLILASSRLGKPLPFSPRPGDAPDSDLGWAYVSAGAMDEDAFFASAARADETVLDVAADLREAGFDEEAARLLGSAVRRNPDCSAMVYYLAGRVPSRLSVGRRFPSRPAEAEALEQALRTDPDDLYARYLLGVLRYGQRRYGEAEALWTDDAHRAPLRGRALCLWRRGERGAAVELLKQALSAAPFCPEEDRPEENAVVWECAYLMNAEGADPGETASLILAHTDQSDLRDDTAMELCKAWSRGGEPESALNLLRTHHFRPGEGSEAAIAMRYIDAQCALGDKLRKAGDLTAARDAYAAAKSIPDWLDGSIGGEGPFLRAMLGEAECRKELSPDDPEELRAADEVISHVADASPDALLRARLYLRVGRIGDAKTLLEKKKAEWTAERDKVDSGYYASQPAYLSYLEPSAAERNRRFAPLIARADELLKTLD